MIYQLKNSSIFFLLLFLCGCTGRLKSNPSFAWDEQECFFLNDLKDDHFYTVSRIVLEDISNMQMEELRSILKVLRKNMDNPTIKHGKIEKIHDNLSRLKSFSYLGWNPVENNESNVPLFLHKTFVDYSNGDIVSRIGFSIQEKKGDALHFDDIVVLDDTKISTPAEIDKRQVVRFDDSFHYVPLEYLIASDSAYCSKRTEIVQKCVDLFQNGKIEEARCFLDDFADLESGNVFWGFSEQDMAIIKESEIEFFDMEIQDGEIKLINAL